MLTDKELLKKIKKDCQIFDITAYEIGINTSISEMTAYNILNNKSENPRRKTLDIISNYIENKKADKQDDTITLNEPSEKYIIEKFSKDKVPFYNIEFSGSHMKNFEEVKDFVSFYVDYEPLNDCTAFIPYSGESMLPKYKSGDALGLKQIKNFDVLLWGESHFVITNENANSIKTVKNIHQHPEENKVILRAINPDYTGDTVVKKDDILSMFIVKGKVELNQI